MTNKQAISHLENMKWLKGYDNTSVSGVPLADIIDDIIVLLQEQNAVKPIEDANTNVPGKWIRLTGMAPPEYHGHKICSICESFAPYDPLHPGREILSPHCPGCGAKMEV